MNLTIKNWEEYTYYLTIYLKESPSQFLVDFEQLPLHYQLKYFKELTRERRQLFYGIVPSELVSQIFGKLSIEHQAIIVEELDKELRSEMFKQLRTDEFVTLLEQVSPEERESFYTLLPEKKRAQLEEILSYDEDSVGSIMTTEFVSISENATADEALQHIRNVAKDAESIYYLFVVNDDNKLMGVLSLRELLVIKDGTTPLHSVMKKQVIALHPHVHQQLAVEAIFEHDLLLLPVVSMTNELIGIITVDDIVDVNEESKKQTKPRFSFTRLFSALL